MKKYRIVGDTENMNHGFAAREIVWIEDDDGTTEPRMTNGSRSRWVSVKDVKEIKIHLPSIVAIIKGWFHK